MSVGMSLIAFFAAAFGIASGLILTPILAFGGAVIFAATLPWQRPGIRKMCRETGLNESDWPL